MKLDYFAFSIIAGLLIALQSALSGQISALIKNPMIASFTVYFFGAITIGIYLLFNKQSIPKLQELEIVPSYLWFLGGVISSVGLTIVYKIMPSFGLANTVVCVVFGQLLLSFVASHYGWFGLPQTSINLWRSIGMILVVIGACIINKE